MQDRTCSIPDCQRRHDARGWCATHYRRWQHHGDPLYVSPQQALRVGNIESRFLAKTVQLDGGCWQWTASAQVRDGVRAYGYFKAGGVGVFSHRWAYEHWIGPIPSGKQIDHFRYPQDGCIGPACVNPAHLRLASPRENTLRGNTIQAANLAKTHCSLGHPYEGDNLWFAKNGDRRCRACDHHYWAVYRDRRPGLRRR